MSVVFDFEAGKGFHFTSAFASRFGAEVSGDQILLPETLGKGFIQEVHLDQGLSLCLHHYTLFQELTLRRYGTGEGEVLTMKFDARKGCQVEFGTSNFFSEVVIPPDEPINFLVVVMTREWLLGLLQSQGEAAAMEEVIRNSPSFFLYEGMTMEMEQVLKRISLIDAATQLRVLLYQIRTQELIYLLIARLLSRKRGVSLPVDPEDIRRIYEVRSSILADVSVPPSLPQVARQVGMSLTKMKQLFRQTFGDSIYNYFQVERMNEAARLLKTLTVSQVGYQIGFSNMSHFTRVFEKHHQIKPKRYKDALEEMP